MTWFTASDQSNWQAGNGMKIIPELIEVFPASVNRSLAA